MHALAQAFVRTGLTTVVVVCALVLSLGCSPFRTTSSVDEIQGVETEQDAYSLQVGLSVVVDNPRDAGEKYFAHRSTSGAVTLYSREAKSGNDWIMYNYHVEVIKLMKMDNGKWVVPTIILERPENRNGQLYWKQELEMPKVTIDNIEDRTNVILADDIVSYVFLIRSTDEPTDWRFIEMSRRQLRYALKTHLMVGDLMTMPLVDKSPLAKEWWAIYERATFAAHSAKDWPEL